MCNKNKLFFVVWVVLRVLFVSALCLTPLLGPIIHADDHVSEISLDKIQKQLNSMVELLQKNSMILPESTIKVEIKEDNEVRTVAKDAGAIVVSTGMLSFLKNIHQMAGVLAHALARIESGDHQGGNKFEDPSTEAAIEADERAIKMMHEAGFSANQFVKYLKRWKNEMYDASLHEKLLYAISGNDGEIQGENALDDRISEVGNPKKKNSEDIRKYFSDLQTYLSENKFLNSERGDLEGKSSPSLTIKQLDFEVVRIKNLTSTPLEQVSALAEYLKEFAAELTDQDHDRSNAKQQNQIEDGWIYEKFLKLLGDRSEIELAQSMPVDEHSRASQFIVNRLTSKEDSLIFRTPGDQQEGADPEKFNDLRRFLESYLKHLPEERSFRLQAALLLHPEMRRGFFSVEPVEAVKLYMTLDAFGFSKISLKDMRLALQDDLVSKSPEPNNSKFVEWVFHDFFELIFKAEVDGEHRIVKIPYPGNVTQDKKIFEEMKSIFPKEYEGRFDGMIHDLEKLPNLREPSPVKVSPVITFQEAEDNLDLTNKKLAEVVMESFFEKVFRGYSFPVNFEAKNIYVTESEGLSKPEIYFATDDRIISFPLPTGHANFWDHLADVLVRVNQPIEKRNTELIFDSLKNLVNTSLGKVEGIMGEKSSVPEKLSKLFDASKNIQGGVPREDFSNFIKAFGSIHEFAQIQEYELNRARMIRVITGGDFINPHAGLGHAYGSPRRGEKTKYEEHMDPRRLLEETMENPDKKTTALRKGKDILFTLYEKQIMDRKTKKLFYHTVFINHGDADRSTQFPGQLTPDAAPAIQNIRAALKLDEKVEKQLEQWLAVDRAMPELTEIFQASFEPDLPKRISKHLAEFKDVGAFTIVRAEEILYEISSREWDSRLENDAKQLGQPTTESLLGLGIRKTLAESHYKVGNSQPLKMVGGDPEDVAKPLFYQPTILEESLLTPELLKAIEKVRLVLDLDKRTEAQLKTLLSERTESGKSFLFELKAIMRSAKLHPFRKERFMQHLNDIKDGGRFARASALEILNELSSREIDNRMKNNPEVLIQQLTKRRVLEVGAAQIKRIVDVLGGRASSKIAHSMHTVFTVAAMHMFTEYYYTGKTDPKYAVLSLLNAPEFWISMQASSIGALIVPKRFSRLSNISPGMEKFAKVLQPMTQNLAVLVTWDIATAYATRAMNGLSKDGKLLTISEIFDSPRLLRHYIGNLFKVVADPNVATEIFPHLFKYRWRSA
jgi:hypothetical protein